MSGGARDAAGVGGGAMGGGATGHPGSWASGGTAGRPGREAGQEEARHRAWEAAPRPSPDRVSFISCMRPDHRAGLAFCSFCLLQVVHRGGEGGVTGGKTRLGRAERETTYLGNLKIRVQTRNDKMNSQNYGCKLLALLGESLRYVGWE